MVGTRVLAWLSSGVLMAALLVAFAIPRGRDAPADGVPFQGALRSGTPGGYGMPPCLPTTRPYSETIIYTKDELLAIWEEGRQRDQDFLAGLNPRDAAAEREERLAARATIEAGPDTVTREINFTEIDYPCEGPASGTPRPGGAHPIASPGAGPPILAPGQWITPVAADCRIAARSVETLWPLLAGSPSDPAPVPGLLERRALGVPADVRTVSAVQTTAREFLACQSIGQPLRAFAVLTDNAIRLALLSGDMAREDLERLATPEGSSATAPAAGEPSEEFVWAVAISDVRTYPDGRIGAVMEINGASPAFVTLVWRGDRALIDAIEEVEPS